MTTKQTLHVQGLEKSYQELQVLRGVDLDVAQGNILALLGSNGAGKTALVRILSTLLKADAGTASVGGYDVAGQASQVRGSISLTGQFAAVDEILSGRENLVLIAQLRHIDEPTTGLDPQARLEVWQTIEELAGQGTTVLLTTQYLDEAERLANRIAILHEGRIIANDTLAELKAILPPARVEYVEKQSSLEDVFLEIVGHDGPESC
jgi:ABC-2 type transport system ATP-binding protein